MRATCPRSRRPAQLPRTEAAEARQETATASYAGAVTREAPRVHETALAEAAAPPAAATESPAATPPPAPVPAPAPAVAGSAGEKRQLSSDSEGEGTMETDAALAPTPSPVARRPRIAEVSAPAAAPAQPTAAPADSPAAQAGPSADAATPYSEMRELAIKKQVTKLARILKESEGEPKENNVDVPAAGKAKKRRSKRRSLSREKDEKMDVSESEESDTASATKKATTPKAEDVVLRPERPQHSTDPPPQSV
ncbi:nischarin-like [Schistocerca serialis cubense]|uniref:nischarin-like n=1 Tax=Schistocerca serialis cubense TaxID=2023355 RepID=UPI00214E2A24|nr:nischarin-like [Schistocerca serialis cubense]XP_049957631.1 nischarin-like [Schistocerca serialis cubense]XP_049957633.1 nischarin-like [Schistocerca serialis cubense]